MSQEKVDKYKKEKYARKHNKKKTNVKKIVSYIIATVVAVAFIVYIGYSVAVATGLYTKQETTTYAKMSDEEIESLRNTLIQNGDSNVKVETTEASENITVEDNDTVTTDENAEATTAAETTKK